jgi:hypothetical protein
MRIAHPGLRSNNNTLFIYLGLLLCSFTTIHTTNTHNQLSDQTIITSENSLLLFDLNDTIVTAATTSQIKLTAQNGLSILSALSKCLCNITFLSNIFSIIRTYHSLDAVFDYLKKLAPQRQQDLQKIRAFIADNLAVQFLDSHNALALQQCHIDKKYTMAIFSNMGNAHFQVLDSQYPTLKHYFNYIALGHKASCWTEDNPYWCHKQEPCFYQDFEQQLKESDTTKIKILFDDNLNVLNYAAQYGIIGVYVPHYTMLPSLIQTITSGHCSIQDIEALNQFHSSWTFKAPLFCKNHPLLIASATIVGYNLCTDWLSKNNVFYI